MVDFIYLQSGERPPPEDVWLLIVKTYGQDFELIVSRGLEVTTLGTDSSLQNAQTRAAAAADSLGLDSVYVIGAPNA